MLHGLILGYEIDPAIQPHLIRNGGVRQLVAHAVAGVHYMQLIVQQQKQLFTLRGQVAHAVAGLELVQHLCLAARRVFHQIQRVILAVLQAIGGILQRSHRRNGAGSGNFGRFAVHADQQVIQLETFSIEELDSVILKSVMRCTDFLSAIDDCGPKSIAIVSLISFLVGLILAFVGAVQLKEFGAQIYVASLVTIGMCRIMGAIMVGIIMAGRTGSSYAATIGTMQVNEELDALQTMGFSRIDFLVTPRLLALLISMPILTMLADIMGMIGGGFVGVLLWDYLCKNTGNILQMLLI